MKGYIANEYIKVPEDLKLRDDLPEPTCPPNGAAGISFASLMVLQGKYQFKPKLPMRPGADVAGIILEVGPNCPKQFYVGQRVFCGGEIAERTAVIPTEETFEVPASLTMAEAAAIGVNYTTSWIGLVNRGRVAKDEVVLVHSGAGGIGSSSIQIAKHLGAYVIATVSSDDKIPVCKTAGADAVLNYATDKEWPEKVKEITRNIPGREREGADIVVDPTGLIIPSTKCTAWNGRLLVVGFTGGKIEQIPANRLLLKNVAAIGVNINGYKKSFGQTTVTEPGVLDDAWRGLFQMFTEGRAPDGQPPKPILYHEKFEGLESLPLALRASSMNRASFGKIMITFGPPEVLVPRSSHL
ncbi:hypothetical protein SmJEL517_g03909 [Synchytrium microbalum]|uniref:Enoyl reductase (ER) domain-containing protein n=1 Tax=Synchytrium microbalum TaxID=1806994 RepID=A0A507C050_9FUNG|nr:uncharacterized protein SmJEL517_g03909 [Synchytrium microbalum]TPX33072.1 hypothetical protein SmJEL517_g03909 [Synchytrium microbalum]